MKALITCLVTASLCLGQTVSPVLTRTTVSKLPQPSGAQAGPYVGLTVWVTDGNTYTDCSTGGGSNSVLCGYTGSTWVSIPTTGLPAQAGDTVLMNASGGSAVPSAVAMPTCTTGAVLYNTSSHAWSCAGTIVTSVHHSFGAAFVNGGNALVAGAGASTYFTVPYACTISAWNITVDAGTATIDIWQVATGTAIPNSGNTITASATPAISTGTAIHSATTTGWASTHGGLAISANDIIGINLKTVNTATQATLDVECDGSN